MVIESVVRDEPKLPDDSEEASKSEWRGLFFNSRL